MKLLFFCTSGLKPFWSSGSIHKCRHATQGRGIVIVLHNCIWHSTCERDRGRRGVNKIKSAWLHSWKTPQWIFQQRDLNNFFDFWLSIFDSRSIDRESLHYFVLKKISWLYTAFYCCGMLYILTRFWVLRAPQSWSKYFLLALSEVCLIFTPLCLFVFFVWNKEKEQKMCSLQLLKGGWQPNENGPKKLENWVSLQRVDQHLGVNQLKWVAKTHFLASFWKIDEKAGWQPNENGPKTLENWVFPTF